jgi:hypothetical protein
MSQDNRSNSSPENQGRQNYQDLVDNFNPQQPTFFRGVTKQDSEALSRAFKTETDAGVVFLPVPPRPPAQGIDILELRKRIEKAIEIKNKEEMGRLLVEAAKVGDIDSVKHLVEKHDVDVNATSNLGTSALFFAAVKEQVEIVKYLVDKKANCEVKGAGPNGTLREYLKEQFIMSGGAAVDDQIIKIVFPKEASALIQEAKKEIEEILKEEELVAREKKEEMKCLVAAITQGGGLMPMPTQAPKPVEHQANASNTPKEVVSQQLS